MIGPIFSFLSNQDAATRAFTARVLAVGMLVALLGLLGSVIGMWFAHIAIPQQLQTLLAFLVGSGVFGVGAQGGQTHTIVQTPPPTIIQAPPAPSTAPPPAARPVSGP